MTVLPALIEQLSRRLANLSATPIAKLFVKVKFADFRQTTIESSAVTVDAAVIARLCEQGFLRGNRPVRLLGIGVRFSESERAQLELF